MHQPTPEKPIRQQEPLPEAHEVAAGIWKLTVPIPFPLRSVNMYALVGNDGWALVDTGMGTPDARAAFTAGLHKAGLSINTLRTIVLSHDHPDHVGLSGELQERSGATVYMHPIDANTMRETWQSMHLALGFAGCPFLAVKHVRNAASQANQEKKPGVGSQWLPTTKEPSK